MIVQCGRQIKSEEIARIRETVEMFWRLSRTELIHTVCEHLGWQTASGSNKVEACQKLLQRLENQGIISLPDKRDTRCPTYRQSEAPCRIQIQAQKQIKGKLSDIGPAKLRVVQEKEEAKLVNEYIDRYHYLGYKQPFGCYLRYFVETKQSLLGCLLFSGASKALKVRDQWIGWSTNERLRNLGLIVNNGRFLIFPWVQIKNLASHVLGKAVNEIGEDWEQRWGYRPALLETFVDPQYFDGTCYRAANFQYLGMTSGIGLVRQGKNYTTSPKKVFVYPLVDNFRQVICSQDTVGRAVR